MQGCLFTSMEDAAVRITQPVRDVRDVRPVRGGGQTGVRFCVLGSGSGGNCSVIDTPAGLMMMDAGLGVATTARRLEQAGRSLDDVRALCVTHLDQDHYRPRWSFVLAERRVTVWAHRWHADRLMRSEAGRPLRDAGLLRTFEDAAFSPLHRVEVAAIRLQHDEQGTSGFRVRVGDVAIGYATDLGHVPPQLIEHFAGVDLLALESNYDPMMQMSSSRPFFLKRRIMNGSGHLSNQQAAEAVTAIAATCADGGPRAVVLLHRSRDCNHPRKIRKLYDALPVLRRRLILAEQRRRTRWIALPPRRAMQRCQPPLFV